MFPYAPGLMSVVVEIFWLPVASNAMAGRLGKEGNTGLLLNIWPRPGAGPESVDAEGRVTLPLIEEPLPRVILPLTIRLPPITVFEPETNMFPVRPAKFAA